MTMASSSVSHRQPYLGGHSTVLVVCITAALSYLVPKVTGTLISNPQTVWPLWPGCAILVTGLLLVRVKVWPLLIPASFVGFALADLQAGVPMSSIVRFIPGNTVEVLISAIGLRYSFDGMPRLNSVRTLAKYSFFAVLLAPFAGAFISAQGIAHDYWTGWKIVFLSEVLAFVTVTPALLSWVTEARVLMRRSRAHHIEGVILIAGLVLVSYIVFTVPEDSRSPTLFYALVPFLLWSALRFGWLGVSTALIAVTSLSIWGAVDGRGPFSNLVPLTNPLPLQMFLVVASIPFMLLAALAEDHERAVHVVRESEERFRLVANTAPVMIWTAGTDRLCTYVNQPWLEFTGRPLEAELGTGWTDGIHHEDLKRCLETYTLAFDQRQSFAMEYRVRRNDGEYRWLHDIGVPRFNRDGSFAGYIGSCLD
ncbi:MAG TPA: MASE1 domain-containing protein, partial [Candidatus Sulfotelmatobacter sp.]|nr:MASE1 domain-containing protein [Candidatus Sulfotelmatobacter sp.]